MSSRGLQQSLESDKLRPDYYDNLRSSSDLLVESDPNSKIYRVTVNETQETFRLAEIKTITAFSEGTLLRQGYQNDAFTALLAVFHFNNPDLSPILSSDALQDCNIRLTMELLDSAFSPVEATRVFTDVLQRPVSLQSPPPAGVVGAYRSTVTSPLVILTGTNDIPQISPASTAVDFDDTASYPLFGRTVTSTLGEAKVALRFFQSVGATHVAILFVTVRAVCWWWSKTVFIVVSALE